MADIGTLNPEQMLQQQQILRQQKMAEMLMQQGMQQPQGQMVSGRYVAPSIFQNIAGLANQFVGQKGIEKAQQAQIDLAKAIRQGDISATADFMKTKQGTPAEMFAAQAGPMPDGGNIPLQESKAAVAPNLQAAYANLAVDPRASARLQNIGLNKMFAEPEAFTLTEGAKRFMTMPDGTVKEVAAGGQKPRSPVSVGNYLVDPESGKVIFQAPEKPTAGQVVERDDGTFLVNTLTGQATPVMGQGGQPLMGAGKPLTESQGKASAFQSQMVSASNAVNTLESQGFDPTSFKSQTAVKLAGGVANPAIPVAAQQYKQAQDQWSEAYLRFKTGAAATEPEVVRNNRTFFPVFGDKPEQIAQKAAAREQAERDIGIAAGRGSMIGAQPIGQQPKQLPAGKNVPAPAGVDPKVWNVMTPQEKALFK
jgi:hypothetical protein